MKRLAALALGVPAILLAGLALGPGGVRAGETDQDGQKIEKRVVVRHAGGSRLGVGLEDTEGDVRGTKVRSVEEGSPAEKAGIQEGDVIVRFDGEAVRSASQLARLVGETPAGRPVAIEIPRGGATQKLTATLAEGSSRVRVFRGDGLPGMHGFNFEMPEWDVEAPEPPEPPSPPHAPTPPHAGVAPHPPMPPRAPMPPHAWSWNGDDGHDMVFRMLGGGPRKLGIEYMEVGEQLAGYFKLGGKTGVLVSSVDPEGPAGKAGMKAGDAVLKLDGKPIEDGDDLRDAVAAAEGGKEVTVTVQRDGRPLDLKVTLAKPETKVRRRSAGVSL
ncbi:MAG TPA: PDZ domain-containing protein [Vicinamibacteria bacterium]|nr:PDZ domain-containing protein [Vicinamibacteria bacterium]